MIKIKKTISLILSLLFLIVGCTNNEKNMEMNQLIKISRDTANLQLAALTKTIDVKDTSTIKLEAVPVAKEINGIRLRMYGYNGQIPGPLIRVKQGSTIYVNFTNSMEMETTVHWHGIRLENKFDGVPDITQKPIKSGESFLYKLNFPDEGVYWYHPHIREDLQQELGLYGNIFVEPKDDNYFNNVDKEAFLFLDDIKMAKADVDVFNPNFARFALMGRFGNFILVNWEQNYTLNVNRGDIVRFYLTNSANTRTFNFSIQDKKLKLIGSDSGKFEREEFVDSVVISPAERYIAEVLLDNPGTFDIQHKIPEKTYILGKVMVFDSNANKSKDFNLLKENKEIKDKINNYSKYFDKAPDYEIDLTIEMPSSMHRDHDMMNNNMMSADSNENIEWEDDMASMNAMMTSKNSKWIMKDKETGKENMDLNYKVKVGDVKKIRIFNDPKSMHPMQHPIHLHGQRFLVLSESGKKNENLVWKDTVLVTKGGTVDLLVDFENPGKWMIHCHIAEHLEAGMMSMFTVSN